MWRRLVKLEIIFLIVVILLVATMPILAKEIDEYKINKVKYTHIIMGLPLNETRVWSGELPQIEDKEKIKKIVIDLSEQKLYLYENNKIVGEYLVSTGKPGMETPTGKFKIYTKNKKQWSKMASLWMPYWMMIEPTKGIGIHELPEWPNGYKEGLNHLGKPVSHGCIRLGVGAAEKVYNWAKLGIKVEIKE